MLPFALLQEVAGVAHPLAGTVARWMWLLPLLPLLGFIVNGALSIVSSFHAGPGDPGAHPHDAHATFEERHEAHTGHDVTGGGAHGDDHHVVVRHRFAGLTTIVGPGVMVAAFALAVAIFLAMRGAGDAALHTPFIQHYYQWIPVGDLHIDAAFQLDQL
jgi:amino acid transporter